MARTTREQEVEQRRTVVEWIIAITTIFWSVWWGFYMQEILSKSSSYVRIPIEYVDPPFTFRLSLDFLLAMNALVVLVFSVTFVRWLWSVQKTAYRHFLVRRLVRASAPLCFSIMILIAGVSLIGSALGISSHLMSYGIILTLLWPAAVLIAVWSF